MGIIKTKGIVIAVANVSDQDKMLTMLTPDLGKISVFCKGAKKNKGSFLACSEFLAFSDLLLFRGNRDIYSLNSAEPIEVFYNLRMDVEKLNYAVTMARILYDVSQEEQRSDKKLQLFLNTLYLLSETEKEPELLFAVFQIRLLAILGFRPNIANCVSCGLPGNHMDAFEDEYYFSIRENGIKCRNCAKQDKGAIKISNATYITFVYILTVDAKKLFSFEVNENTIQELRLVASIYTTEKLEKEYKVQKY